MRAEPRWSDAVALILEHRLGRFPTQTEIQEADADAVRAAEESLLRRLHAMQAERLALATWRDSRGEEQRLIEDSELRRAFGPLIGRLAHSHWWETTQLPHEFNASLGALPGHPSEWTVDPLPLACLLRVVDALHLDARRAPMFLRALRQPAGYSADHWSFQERLLVPQVRGDRVQFTSGDPFPAIERGAWWLCFETLSAIDRWLREVDALLADIGRERLAVRGVAGVEAPERLSRLIPTSGWSPVDTHVQISDVASLIEKLGGREMYGDDLSVGLRELIQNGADAVRARRLLQRLPDHWGTVTVTIGEQDGSYWLEVADTGVGMSEQVLTKGLLDFGTSFWASPELPAEFPGLLSSGVEITGKFGIGFFSVFMLGSQVRVTTRPFRGAESETLVLEFENGLHERPVLRRATEDEQLPDGGTAIKVWLDTPPGDEGGLLKRDELRPAWTLGALCAMLCPGLDVSVRARMPPAAEAVIAEDWKTMEPDALVARLQLVDTRHITTDKKLLQFIPNIRPIHNPDGSLVARLAVYPYGEFFGDAGYPGAMSIGGLYGGSLFGLMGVALARPLSAVRSDAEPIVDLRELKAWATEQAFLVSELKLDSADQAKCAEIINMCGGEASPLVIGRTSDGWLTGGGLREWAAARSRIVLSRSMDESATVADDTLVAASGWMTLVPGSKFYEPTWPEFGPWSDALDTVALRSSLTPLFIALIAESWSTTIKDLCACSQMSGLVDHHSAVVCITDSGEEITDDLVHILQRD